MKYNKMFIRMFFKKSVAGEDTEKLEHLYTEKCSLWKAESFL